MKLLKNLLSLLVIVLVMLIAWRWYLGWFSTPVATEGPMGPYVMAYIDFTGEYSKVWPVMTKLYDALSGAKITSYTGMGIYYDDPEAVSGQNLRSEVGSMIATTDLQKLDKKSPDYKIKVVNGGNKIIVMFPFKNTFSYMVGAIKAYPVMNAYLTDKGYLTEMPRIELYDLTAKKIYYMVDIVK